ncbi:MAG: hypothetical protein H0X34_02630 [Chthoniobacterales bacterium]|nr:hypothetical protein [Chthoniobacterales bacterium]
MDWLRKRSLRREQAAALIIVLAFVVLLTGLVVAYFSRATSDQPVAQASFNQSKADQLAASAADNIIGDLRQEIVNGSSPTPAPDVKLYVPTVNANILPQKSGTPPAGSTPFPNLIRRSIRSDAIPPPGVGSRASAVASGPPPSPSPVVTRKGEISPARWNKHYLIPRDQGIYGGSNGVKIGTDPDPAFVPPDWVFLTSNGPGVITQPSTSVIGRYAYAIYDEGGLLDMNVAGYPTGTTAIQSGRKGSVAFADLTVMGNYGLPNPSSDTPPVYQIDRIVGWRNYATTKPANSFPDNSPPPKVFANNFQTDPTRATDYFNTVINNPTGFLKARGDPSPVPTPWPNPSAAPYPAVNGQTDQMFLSRQQLIAFRNTTRFSQDALQYLSTFSRESNSPSLSPVTPPGSSIPYAFLASTASPNEPTAVNPNFLRRRVTGAFTRFDGTSTVVGEPLINTRFPLSRLAWITYKGPSAVVYTANNSDPAITQLTTAGVPISTIQAGTAANIKTCFGLVWDSRAYVPASGTTPSQGQQWVYDSPRSTNGGGTFDPVSAPTGIPASDIKRLDVVVSENREPDFFEVLRATILDGSLGQNTGGGVTGGATVFPDIHMSNKAHHILSIGASIMDQADPDSIPIRVQFKPTTAATWWTAYGVESLPYITQIYPASGTDPADSTSWVTYLLFQLWNPHQNTPARPAVRLRVDGGLGLFAGGNGQVWNSTTGTFFSASGQSVTLNSTATFAPSPAPLYTTNCTTTGTTAGTFVALPIPPASSTTPYVGFRLPDARTSPTPFPTPTASPRLMLQVGASSPSALPATSHPFTATLEVDTGGGVFVPYNHFEGISDTMSWINDAPIGVRDANSTGTPRAFTATQLTQSPPASFMKADPRATRFGIFQIDANITSTARMTNPLWPSASSTVPNGYGGAAADGSPPVAGNPLEHVPLRFASAAYFPATFCINDGNANSIRNTVTTSYADNDAIIRPADATYPDPSLTTTGSSTPYYATATATSTDYHPVILNRPFRNVAELGYAFRDLPWKSLDFFTDHSADAGLLDVFTINDGIGLWAANGTFSAMGPVPTMIAGQVNLNTGQAAVLQSILAGAIWNELDQTDTVSKTGITATAAPVIAANIVAATSAVPLRNRSELMTGPSPTPNPITTPVPLAALPTPSGGIHDQSVKTRREVVGRAISSVTQTRTWNLLIDVIAQSGKYAPGEADLTNFIVEGEQRYWVHVAIDRFTGEVIDRQVEVVKD